MQAVLIGASFWRGLHFRAMEKRTQKVIRHAELARRFKG
jgi:uncharacterized protein with PIN domain